MDEKNPFIFEKRRMRWDELEAFIVVSRVGSFSAAAARLGLSIATIGRRIDALEHDLGLALVRRGRTGATLSSAGLRLLESAKVAEHGLHDVTRAADAIRTDVRQQPVQISATEPVIADILTPALPSLQSQSPGITLDLTTSVAVADFDRHETDIALRLFRPEGQTLMARKLPNIEIGCFANAQYLAGRDPKGLDLASEQLLILSDVYGDIAEVAWVRAQGIESAAVLRSSSSRGLLMAAAAGAGIAIGPRFLARRLGLIEITTQPIRSRPCWMVSHRDSRSNRAIATVKRWVVDVMSEALAGPGIE